ncbi:hypothetical protein [Streptomyces sp. NPDC090025]|uniref:hypothetical protein n=1 Tax=Streptomyces sp. NPDC090025 TaxID=3365922 RepID=UPI0038353683
MRPRPILATAVLLLAVTATVTGCVAVPELPPRTTRPAVELAPHDDRPPTPLPSAWPPPTQDAPREALALTDPTDPASAAPSPAGTPRATARPPAVDASPAHPPGHAQRSADKPRSAKKPRPKPAAVPKRTVAPRPASTAGDLRALCREAERVQIPYGVPALCRGTYGR